MRLVIRLTTRWLKARMHRLRLLWAGLLSAGIAVPPRWRERITIAISIVAVASIGVTVHILDQEQQKQPPTAPEATAAASNQVNSQNNTGQQGVATQAVRPSILPEIDKTTFLAYEEALPDDLIEQAPVSEPAAGDQRFTVPEEYIPQPLTLAVNPETTSTASAATQNKIRRQKERERDFLSFQSSQPAHSFHSSPAPIPPVLEQIIMEISIARLNQGEGEQAEIPPWQANSPPFDLNTHNHTPMIAIVMDDMGIDQRRSEIAVNLPGPLTLSYLTYAKNLEKQTRAARENGHELMLHVPMQPESATVDPGPMVLKTGDAPGKILEHLRWGLSRFDGYVGINNHMGSQFTGDLDGMRIVLAETKRQGLLFLDSRTSSGSTAQVAAREFDVPFATRNVFLDHVDEAGKILEQLAETERLARKNGSAIAIGHPRDATLAALARWIETLDEKGFVLAPVSAIIRHNWKPAPAIAAISAP